MTSAVIPFPRRARRVSSVSLTEKLAFAAAVLMLLIYSQGWVLPLVGDGDETADSVLLRTLFLPAYALGIALMALTPWRLVQSLTRQPFMIAIMVVAALSIFWSVSPDQTSRRIFALLFTTLGGAVLAARYSWARLAEVLAASFAILALCSLITGLFVPSIGRMTDIFPGAWRGLWQEKNNFGDNMALGASFCAAAAILNPKRATLWWGAAMLCFLLVIMSTSKTSLVSELIGAAALPLVWAVRRGRAASVAASWAVVAAIIGAIAVMTFAADAVFGALGKDATLTGRTQIWAAVIRQIKERPWQGFGYAAIWDNTDRWSPLIRITHEIGFRAHHSHNSWLEQWLGLGVPGLVAWSAFYFQTLLANVVALYRSPGAFLALPFFVIYSLTTLTESIAVVYNDARWVMFVAIAVKLAMPDPAPQRTAPGRPASNRRLASDRRPASERPATWPTT